jgi:hypothetical protein
VKLAFVVSAAKKDLIQDVGFVYLVIVRKLNDENASANGSVKLL